MKKIIFFLIIILILFLAGLFEYRQIQKSKTNQTPQFKTAIDRNLKPEDQKRLQEKITEILTKIGNDRQIEDLESWIELANYRSILGDLASAEETLKIALELNSLNYVAWGNLASVREERGDLGGAEDAYRKAIDLMPIAVFYVKYTDFLKNNFFPERIDDYESLLKIAVARFGQLPEFIGALAIFYEEQGRFEEALSHYRVLLPENPERQKDINRVEEKKRKQN